MQEIRLPDLKVTTGAVKFNDEKPGLYLDGERVIVYAIHLREVLDTLPKQFDKEPKDPVDMLLYMAISDLRNLSNYMYNIGFSKNAL